MLMKRLIHTFKMNEFADKIEAIDVGIDEFGFCDSPTSDAVFDDGSKGLLYGHSFSEITYIHIHECDDFSVRIRKNIKSCLLYNVSSFVSITCSLVAFFDIIENYVKYNHVTIFNFGKMK